jgi:DNA-3-methyladenine glycosylase (3mg)
MKKLNRKFYDREATIVAKELLGKVLVHEVNGKRIAAKIVETEAYMGLADKAAHSYGGKRTDRVEVMYGEAGHSYVFIIYGIHHCFNVVVGGKENPQAVLIRAVEPIEGLEFMAQKRFEKQSTELTKVQQKNLTNGPGKLSNALFIDRTLNGVDLCENQLYIERGKTEEFSIVETKRVGIDYAEEAKDFPWRFYIEGNVYVSVK